MVAEGGKAFGSEFGSGCFRSGQGSRERGIPGDVRRANGKGCRLSPCWRIQGLAVGDSSEKILELRRKELRFKGSLPLIRESDDGSVVFVEPADERSLTPEQAALREETIQRIRRCVARLPAEQCEAILSYLCFNYSGRKREEVAQQLGVPDPTLASRLKKARRLLSECLEREGLRPESPRPESQECYSSSDHVACH